MVPFTRPFHRIVFVCSMLLIVAPTRAQEKALRPHMELGGGINILTSPGTGLRSGMGGSGHLAAGLSIEADLLSFHPRLVISTAGFRSHMAPGTHFVSQRSALDLELAVGRELPNGPTVVAGIFAGTVLEAHTMVETRYANVVRGQTVPTMLSDHHVHPRRAGIVLGALLPLGRAHRWAWCVRLRQHLIPLVQEDQFQVLANGDAYRVLSGNTRPTELTLGLGFWFR